MTTPFDKRQARALESLLRGWTGGQVVLIGAGALGCSIEMTWRSTHDLDLVLACTTGDLKTGLPKLGLRQDPRIEHRWVEEGGVAFDIIALTKAQIAEGKFTWPLSGNEMTLVGIDLALEHTFDVPIGTSTSVAVASLPALTVLKMAAWLDNPSGRSRDLRDLGHVLCDYLPPDNMRRWEDERLSAESFDTQSAMALGLDVGEIAKATHMKVVRTFVGQLKDVEGAALHLLSGATGAEGHERHAAAARHLLAFGQGADHAWSAQNRRSRPATHRVRKHKEPNRGR